MPLRFYTRECLGNIAQADSFTELYCVGRDSLERMPAPAVMVCGPISSGGFGREQNGAIFQQAIELLVEKYDSDPERNLPVFNQWPFERAMHRLIAKYGKPGEYCKDVLELFYQPLIASGRIKRGYFLRGWESSIGAKWEHERFREYRLEIDDYPPHLYDKILGFAVALRA